MPRILMLAVLVGLFALPTDAFAADQKTKIDESKIYYGDPGCFTKPAVLKIAEVFNAIPEYQEAKKKGKDDPQYYILLEKANQKFTQAMEKVAEEKGYDLIGEVGSIQIEGKNVPDITKEVIKALPK